jgi:colanic acid biosynthesis glycosyl transferase WcaI
MRILLLTLCYLPDAAPNASVMTALAEGLRDLGHEVFVVTAFPHYGQGRPYAGYGGWRLRNERHNGIHISRTPVYVGKGGSNASKILSWLSFNSIGTWAALKGAPADVIISPSPPPTLGLSEWLLASLWRVPYIYNVQDVYPDVAIEQGLLTNPHLIALLRKVERLVYDKAAAVAVVSEAHRDNVLSKGVPRQKIAVIPNFVDTDFLRPLPRHNPWSAEQEMDDHFVVAYAGNIGVSQGLETLLGAASRLKTHEDIAFLVIGRGTARAALQARARNSGLNNVRFVTFQPRKRLPEVYATTDVHLVLLRRGITGSMPSKTYSIMASGRPLVAAVEPQHEVANLVQRAGAGLVVPPEDPEALAEAILTLRKDREKRHRMGEFGRAHVAEHYSKQAVASQYDALIRRMVTRPRTRGRHVRHRG